MRGPSVRRRLTLACSALLLCAQPAARGAAPAAGETLKDVTFSRYSERSDNAELARRLLSPLAAARLKSDVARSGSALTGQPIKLADESFIVYIPPQRPPKGFGLLVFVPPWDDARLPPGWSTTLDHYGVVFVSAARSGNDENPLSRREPLALLAAENIMAQYPVDPERTYVGGFSGGSRVALRLALGYPDLFRGAILNAGSDPIGSREIPLPPRDLFLKFQGSSRIAYITGERDTAHAADDSISLRSMHRWCVFNTESQAEARAEHAVAGAASLSWALRYLGESARAEPERLAKCSAGIEAELSTGLESVDTLIAQGRRADAQKQLAAIDERFGGLAAPRSVELAARLP